MSVREKRSEKEIFHLLAPAAYAKAAVLAATVGQEMLARLALVTLQPRVVLDVGCGTGDMALALQTRYPQAQVVGIDVAYPMLQFARTQAAMPPLLCADAMRLPFAAQSVDLIFANLLLPWCTDLPLLMREWRRVLRPDGLLMFTSFGPDSLRVWREELGNLMVPDFLDMHELGDVLTKSRFIDPVMDVDYYTLHFRHEMDLCQELYASGLLLTADFTLLNPAAGEVTPGVHAAVFEIVYGHAWGPTTLVDQVMDEMGVVNIPLASLRRR